MELNGRSRLELSGQELLDLIENGRDDIPDYFMGWFIANRIVSLEAYYAMLQELDAPSQPAHYAGVFLS